MLKRRELLMSGVATAALTALPLPAVLVKPVVEAPARYIGYGSSVSLQHTRSGQMLADEVAWIEMTQHEHKVIHQVLSVIDKGMFDLKDYAENVRGLEAAGKFRIVEDTSHWPTKPDGSRITWQLVDPV